MASSSKGSGYQLPWVEKYRPRRLADVVGNAATIERLRVIEENGNCPHLLVSGLPGIGKTTAVHCLASALLGDAYKEAVLELNASDDRGIDVVRNKIIEPLQSRCAILRFGRLADDELLQRLVEICRAEKVEYTDEGLAAVVFTAEGDMRQAVNNLQSTWAGQGFVNPDNVFKVCDQPHPLLMREILERCHRGDVDGALDKLDEVWASGYSSLDIVTTLFRVVRTMDSLSEPVKLEFIREIGWTHMRVLEGVGTLLQLGGLVARLSRQAVEPRLLAL